MSLPAKGVADGPAVAFVRPHDFTPAKTGLEGVIRHVVAQGPLAKIEVEVGGRTADVVAPRVEAETRKAGEPITLAVRKAHVYPL